MSYFLKFLTSVKLAVVLLILIILFCIFASFIPQGRDEAFYTAAYSFMGPFIIKLQFHHFFRSYLFFITIILFFINLLSCTVLRIVRRAKKAMPLRPGPDIIHIGMLLVIIGGTVSLFNHREASVKLSEGEGFELPDGRATLTLRKFDIQLYKDGRPKDWLSHVELFENNISKGTFKIEVNSPLSWKGYKIYQTSFVHEPSVFLISDEGQRISLVQGEGVVFEDTGYLVDEIQGAGSENPRIHFTLMEGEVSIEEVKSPGDKTGQLLVGDVFIKKESGLQIVTDRGNILIIAALIFITAGLFLTFYQKMGDQKK